MKPKPINIKIKFGRAVVTLPTASDRIKTHEGVELYVKPQPGGAIRAWAAIPDGTLDQYKHTQPVILSCDWIY